MKSGNSNLILTNNGAGIQLYKDDVCTELIRRGLNELEGHDAEYWYKKGKREQDLKDNENAVEYYRKALELEPDHKDTLNGMAFCWLHSEKKCFKNNPEKEHRACLEESVRIYEHLHEIGDIDSRTLNNLAVAKNRLGFPDEAIDLYRRAIQANPKDYLPWANAGVLLYYDEKNIKKALQCLEKSIELRRDYPYPYHTLGNIYNKSNEFRRAVENFQKYLTYEDYSEEENHRTIKKAEQYIFKHKDCPLREIVSDRLNLLYQDRDAYNEDCYDYRMTLKKIDFFTKIDGRLNRKEITEEDALKEMQEWRIPAVMRGNE